MSEGIFENFIDTLGAAFLEWVVFFKGDGYWNGRSFVLAAQLLWQLPNL